jgi:hypothetical protein
MRKPIHIPNSIPLSQRFWSALGAGALILWGGYSLYVNDLVIPLRRRKDIHLHDEPAFLMFAAFICGALVLISVIIDHYDERNNEHQYKKFSETLKTVGWFLFGAALLLHMMMRLGKTFNA